MLHEFLTNNLDELTARCREKVRARPGRGASPVQLENGVPMFLDQLIRTLRVEESISPTDSRRISGPDGGARTLSEVSVTASEHGKNLLKMGFSVDQVVHDYGDLCQAITDLAVESETPFRVTEFRTLNRCLDNAISDAVTEFSYQRDRVVAEVINAESSVRVSAYLDELRELLGTASLAFAATKAGNLSLGGATGSILERTRNSLKRLIEDAVQNISAASNDQATLTAFSLATMIADVAGTSKVGGYASNCTLCVEPVDESLALQGNRELLMAAVAYVVQDALRYSLPDTEVLLTAYAAAEYILIDVKDHCGVLAPGVGETMFLPYPQRNGHQAGTGHGLAVAMESIKANNGILSVRNAPGTGCVFTISFPRYDLPN